MILRRLSRSLREAGSEVTVETDLRGRGLIRTSAGWFAISRLTPSSDGARLSFRIHGDREVRGPGVTNGPAGPVDRDEP